MVDGAVSATKEEWKSSTGSHGSLSTGSKYKTTWINSPTSHYPTVCEASSAHARSLRALTVEAKTYISSRAEKRLPQTPASVATISQSTIRENSCSLDCRTCEMQTQEDKKPRGIPKLRRGRDQGEKCGMHEQKRWNVTSTLGLEDDNKPLRKALAYSRQTVYIPYLQASKCKSTKYKCDQPSRLDSWTSIRIVLDEIRGCS